MTHTCKSIGCTTQISETVDFCSECLALNTPGQVQLSFDFDSDEASPPKQRSRQFQNANRNENVDVFGIHQLFEIRDFSGCIHQASTKLLLSGDNSTSRPLVQDITDARDFLNRWLELNDADH